MQSSFKTIMRVMFVLLTASTFFSCSNAAESTVLKTDPTKDIHVEGFAGRRLRSYDMSDLDNASEERAGTFDVSKLDSLMSADKIKKALENIDDQEALFKTWHVNEATSTAVVDRLMKKDKRLENMPILLQYNNFRTRHKFNTVLDTWLDTKTLDEMFAALQNFKTSAMKEYFTKFYNNGITPEQFTAAIANIKNSDKRKRYSAFEVHYKFFVDMKDREAAKAAKKAMEAVN